MKNTGTDQNVFKTERSSHFFDRAQRVIPGGVNSPVRAFKNVNRHPVFIKRGNGSRIWDEDHNEYIDYVGSWGPLLMGHAHPAVVDAVTEAASKGLSFGAATQGEVLLAEQVVANVPGVESLRLVNSGTEAVMSAIRLARGFTGRERIVKFTGCYHGHSDGLLVAAGSGLMTQGVPDSAGVPAAFTELTVPANYNDAEGIKALFEKIGDTIAAVIIEPVAANMGVCPPAEGFLQLLRELTSKHGALLIFDEVITGFRLSFGGAQAYFDVPADLVTYGKIIGGGMPMGAYGGRKDIMSEVSPVGAVYQAGTLSGNPLAVAAGRAMLDLLLGDSSLYDRLEQKGAYLEKGFREAAAEVGVPVQLNRVCSLMSIFFTSDPVTDYASAQSSNTDQYATYFNAMLEQGIYIAPSQFEALFVGAYHSMAQLEYTVDCSRRAFAQVAAQG